MLIACKHEEIWAPEVLDFVNINDKVYTRVRGHLDKQVCGCTCHCQHDMLSI
ncbi:hypothetical protein V8C86DRAFT_2775747 [Haematococcus lacustris]